MAKKDVNYISEVIVRVDAPINFVFANKELPKGFEKKILEIFSQPEPQKIQGKERNFSDSNFIASDLEKIERNFHDSNRTKTLTISENTLFIKYNKYESFENLKKDRNYVIDHFLSFLPADTQFNRMGLRYVNNIQLGGNQSERKKILNKKLLQSFDLKLDNISRGFSIINLNEEGIKTNFQYGIINPDFPALIRNNLFILDYDVFYEGILDKTEIKDNLVVFHDKIKYLLNLSLANGSR